MPGNTDMGFQDTLSALNDRGGWRMAMQDAWACPVGVIACLDTARARQSPGVVLGLIFAAAKVGQTEEARRAFERFLPLIKKAALQDTGLAADVVLVDVHLSIYEDRICDAAMAERVRWAQARLREDDWIGRALVSNHLCNIALQMGDFDRGQKHAEDAIALYRRGGAVFGALHLHTHLAQIRLARGDLRAASEVLKTMEAELRAMPGPTQNLVAVSRILQAEVAYEANDLPAARHLRDAAFRFVEGHDAWSDILVAAYRVNARLAFADAGLPGALEAMSHGERIAVERRMPRLRRLMQVERLRALALSNEIKAAQRLLEDIGLTTDRAVIEESDDFALRQGSTLVAAARLLTRTRRAREALGFIATAEDLAIRRGQLLALAKLRVIAAHAHWSLGTKTEAVGSLLSAIRLLGDQPFARFIIDEGDDMHAIVQAVLDGDHVSVPPTRAQRRRLSDILLHWTGAPRATRHDAGDEAQALRRRYLELLALGHTNKEIGRIMGVSTNTVKYHLKHIFRDLRADNRARAVQRARDLGYLA
ncbi:LuxR C-terminal-related transcriptional regulator [Meridianimarinicoccus roseus]|nr:LuxR C-terminal-related transcriptional regulator [Meridianimarinicoccus roseus]